ncbi:hypothetical protein [Streptomyces scopuliridis]|uniref:hypothetical protein n=1 Tax=Streptomyces scopuliridis TaxID=452529 RepID=UPI00343D9CEB
MKRTEAIKYHTEEAEAADRIAATAPGTSGADQLADNARDHRAYADAARVGDYDLADLED